MPNILKVEKQRQILHLLAEGNSIRGTERLTGINRDTIMRYIGKFGLRCRVLLDERMRNLTLRHIELDEMWTYVSKHQRYLTIEEKQYCHDKGDIFLWTAIDMDTKLLPTFALGKRSADNCRRFLMDLAKRLRFPNPHASDAHRFQASGYPVVCQLSSDAFAAYPEAVDLAFGPYAKYGQLLKNYRNADQPGRYAAPEMIAAERRAIFRIAPAEKHTICTSHIERHNATTRLFMKRLNRLTLCYSKKLANLVAATSIYVAFYNFCWQPRIKGKPRGTPAMRAGLELYPWSFVDLFDRASAVDLSSRNFSED
jgi:IS1 family transposase